VGSAGPRRLAEVDGAVGWLNGRIVDLAVIVPIAWRVLAGYRHGLVAVLAGLAGRVVVAAIAWREAPDFLGWHPVRLPAADLRRWVAREAAALHLVAGPRAAEPLAAWIARAAAFAVLYVVLGFALRRAADLVSRVVNRVPLVGSVNRLTGAVAAGAGAALAAAVLLVVAADLGASWHVRQLVLAERHSAAAEALLPVGRSLVSWVLHGLPRGGGWRWAGLPALPGVRG
jgi:uncharacterized membrane protein required for colicin V production